MQCMQSGAGANKHAMNGAIDLLIGITERANPPETADYRDSDGFLVCGKCHTRREYLLKMDDAVTGLTIQKKVPVMCQCRQAADREDEMRDKQLKDMAAVRKLKRASLMSEKFSGAAFTTYTVYQGNQKAFSISKRYVENFTSLCAEGQGLLFYGPVGTGKSYTAAMIANELMIQKHSVLMTSFVKLLEKGYRSFDEEEREYRLNRVELLIIDDLGAERSTDTAMEKVYSIIDSRSRSGKPLILTTNLNIKQMKEVEDIRYARIYERILEVCYPVKMDGPSWRKKEAAIRYHTMKNLLEG